MVKVVRDHMSYSVLIRCMVLGLSQVRIWNMRLNIMMLVGVTRDLAEYGPAKPESEHGVDDIRACMQVG